MNTVRILPVVSLLLSFSCSAVELPPWLEGDTQNLLPEVIEWRRDIHRNPELSNAEERTSRMVAEKLKSWGLDVKTGVAKHGVVAVLRGGKPGPVVAIRADMDALPIEEATNLSFKSTTPGVMHACGHDGHTAVALGVAKLLVKRKAELPGTVKFLFQPAEEGMPVHFTGTWGGKLMVEEGALNDPSPEAIFALHCQPLATIINASGEREDVPFRTGQVGYAEGAISANSDRFSIKVRGKMAHGSAPHRGVDAIQVAAAIITELQTIRSRHIDTQEPLVVTVGTIKGGQRENIIAPEAEMTGTVRTHSTRVQERVMELIPQIASRVAEAHGAKAEVHYRKGYPASINNPALVRRMMPVLEKALGRENLLPLQPSMGGEDFAYFAQKVPSFYIRLGVTRPGVEKPAGLHTPEFEMDENAMLTGLRAISAMVWARLAEAATP
jgi:amidohydrolase